MARVGTGNFKPPLLVPERQQQFWRESMDREQRNHFYHPLNVPQKASSFTALDSVTRDTFARTWQIEKNSYSQAAGKSSYHYNVCKPMGNRVDMGNKSSASFEQPRRSRVRPFPVRFSTGGNFDRSGSAPEL